MALFLIWGTWEDLTHVSTKHWLLQLSLCPHHIHPAVGSVLFLKAHLCEVGADFTYIWGSGGIYTADTFYFQVRLFFFVCLFWIFPEQGSNPGPLPWDWGVLATGPPGESQHDPFIQQSHFWEFILQRNLHLARFSLKPCPVYPKTGSSSMSLSSVTNEISYNQSFQTIGYSVTVNKEWGRFVSASMRKTTKVY